ncbi:ATPase, AFG1 family [hydrothermal vent metagenome]|uniref:ATPase, AFG1 family n=1 Tax=hydrothermal vent metagenome TaxID=652676 RepID=A0A3B0ZZY7_9ZZZZ
MTPLESYQQDLRRSDFLPDVAQQHAVELTNALYEKLLQANNQGAPSFLAQWLNKKPDYIKGLYFWGGTGRGKTYLIDCFYECLPFKDKHRIHFHHFMLDVHEQLRTLPKSPNPLVIVAEKFAKQYQVLCLDEFHVHDIADAMLMVGLLKILVDNGVTIVASSNIAIKNLYLNGLQRERFLEVIRLLEQVTTEYNLGDDTDYRFNKLEKSTIYFVGLNAKTTDSITACFENIVPTKPKHNRQIEINNRKLDYLALADDVIWFDYSALCETARSAHDYIEIAQIYTTVVISNIPVMDESYDSAAKRFIHLVDALYDHNVKLICSAEAEPDELYIAKRLAFAFDRTISRLTEMQTNNYLALPHSISGKRTVYAEDEQ